MLLPCLKLLGFYINQLVRFERRKHGNSAQCYNFTELIKITAVFVPKCITLKSGYKQMALLKYNGSVAFETVPYH